MQRSELIFRDANFEVIADEVSGIFFVAVNESVVSVYECELRHHNPKLLDTIIDECRVKQPRGSLDKTSFSYSMLFAHHQRGYKWSWERELFRDVALLTDTHLEKARLARLKRLVSQLEKTTMPPDRVEATEAIIRSFGPEITWLENHEVFFKDVSKLSTLERFFQKHDLEHPQITVTRHRSDGVAVSKRQSYFIEIQRRVLVIGGRVFKTPNGTVQSYLPDLDSSKLDKLTQCLSEIWETLSPEQKDVAYLLSSKYGSTVLAIFLVNGDSTPSAYAQSLLACEGEGVHGRPKIGDNPTHDEVIIDNAFTDEHLEEFDENNNERFSKFLSDAQMALDYLALCKNPILDLITSGEKVDVEFKSSFRWDVREGRINKQIQGASLKTLVAFLNSGGGTLVIGVADDGSIWGIEHDQYENHDQYERAVISTIKDRIGSDFTDAVQLIFHQIGQKEVLSIECKSEHSKGLAFLDDECFVRQGPMSVPLTGRRLAEYVSRDAPSQ